MQASSVAVGGDLPATQELLGVVGKERMSLLTLAQTLDSGLASRATGSEPSRCVLATKSELCPVQE